MSTEGAPGTIAVESRVRALETELQSATERSMQAKKAVKDAKALAKAAKKEKRAARRALIAAQEEHAAALLAADKESKGKSRTSKSGKLKSGSTTALKVRIADSPETNPRAVAVRKRAARSKLAKRTPANKAAAELADEPAVTNADVAAADDESASQPDSSGSVDDRTSS